MSDAAKGVRLSVTPPLYLRCSLKNVSNTTDWRDPSALCTKASSFMGFSTLGDTVPSSFTLVMGLVFAALAWVKASVAAE